MKEVLCWKIERHNLPVDGGEEKTNLHPVTDVELHEASLANHCFSTVLISILGV